MRVHSSSLFPVLAIGLAAVQGKRVVENWDITYVTTNRGLHMDTKQAIGVNNALPLPVVRASKGDTLILNVRNSLDVPTSLHAHGIFQRGTNYYDGVPMTTSCPIAPGTNFTYVIPLEQAGTFWIHGHAKEQNFDGLRTPLIIQDPKDPYPTDGEYLFAVEDWWPVTYKETYDLITADKGPKNPYEKPPSSLINGFNSSLIKPISFAPGKSYRIRLINMSSLPYMEFSIDDHELQVIEVEGVSTKPKSVNVVRLSSGQRVSVLVKAKKRSNLNYKYHITVLGDFLPPIPNVYPSYFESSVTYNADAPYFERTGDLPSEPFDDLAIESLEHNPAMRPDVSLFLNLTSGYTPDSYQYHESIDFVAYEDPLVPTIFSALTTGDMAINPITYGPQTNAHVLRYNDVVEVLLWSPTIRPHPMHLHGHTFQVIERGKVTDVDGSVRRRVPQSKHYSPLMRDTVLVDVHEYVVIRFKADNPGIWSLHCHLDWHLGQGLNMLFVEAPREMTDALNVPQDIVDQCHAQGVSTVGNVVGRNTYNYLGAPDLPRLLGSSPFDLTI
ncbi:ferroxidase fet3 [Coemansia sp. Benny D115]|nr:ferroxidase fet3 [Coemansia sp. Benny D115]